MKTKWIVQKNLNDDDRCLVFIFEEHGIAYEHVDIIPFNWEKFPDFDNDVPLVSRGTTTTLRAVENKGWKPGVWHNENFKPSKYKEYYGENFLNHQGVALDIQDAAKAWDILDGGQHLFVRPNSDYKEMTGAPMTKNDVIGMARGVASGQYYFGKELEVWIAPLKQVVDEYRFVVVNGNIASGYSYRINKRLINKPAPDSVWGYAKELAKDGPDEVFSLDIGVAQDGKMGVIECNCFNASGIYGDHENVILKVTDFVEQKYA